MINRHLLAYGNDPGLREGHEVRWWRTWTGQRPVWPVFVVSHWTGSSFFDLLHAFPRLSYANSGRTRRGNMLELSGWGQRLPLLFSTSFPHYISSFLASSPLKQLDRFWHERKWVLSGWERWGCHSYCDPHHLWGSSVLQWSSVMCLLSCIWSGSCSVYWHLGILRATPLVVL